MSSGTSPATALPTALACSKVPAVTEAWTINGLLRSLADRRQHPAVLVPAQTGTTMLDCGTLADYAAALARGLRFAGVTAGTSVVLWAPNSPEWIAASLAILAAGGVLVPVDDSADAAQFALAMDISGAPLVFTAQGHLAIVQAYIRAHGKQVFHSTSPNRPALYRLGERCFDIRAMRCPRPRMTCRRLCSSRPARQARQRHSI